MPIPVGTWENWHDDDESPNYWYSQLDPDEYPALGFIPQDFEGPTRDGGVDLLNFDPSNLVSLELSDTYETSNQTTPTRLRNYDNYKKRVKINGKIKSAEVTEYAIYGGSCFMTGKGGRVQVIHINPVTMPLKEGFMIDKMSAQKPGTFIPCGRPNLANAKPDPHLEEDRDDWIHSVVLSPNNLEPIPAGCSYSSQPHQSAQRQSGSQTCGASPLQKTFPTTDREGEDLILWDPTTRQQLHRLEPNRLLRANGVVYVGSNHPELLFFRSAASIYRLIGDREIAEGETLRPGEKPFNVWQEYTLAAIQRTFKGCFNGEIKPDTAEEWNRDFLSIEPIPRPRKLVDNVPAVRPGLQSPINSDIDAPGPSTRRTKRALLPVVDDIDKVLRKGSTKVTEDISEPEVDAPARNTRAASKKRGSDALGSEKKSEKVLQKKTSQVIEKKKSQTMKKSKSMTVTASNANEAGLGPNKIAARGRKRATSATAVQQDQIPKQKKSKR
ncbi:hypothetical protein CYLTODRAFT_413163 [Cylindrobasidium torrendii FP15055 ss-10]|uniref:Uncharacterized protein n=1 Tax=Cylindrobasidium torrendii FP15055 ss-10 TaxID=1314674 RepID=A0A0D7B2H7_9AGAR|nr:hypothetical protein CYLTODRAFT_413163 [Cylindrobasidium torrendii FP15055 ss-10]